MLKLGRVVRSNIIKGKIDTINISKTLLTTLPHKECDIDLFSSTLKKCGYSLTVFSDSSSTSNSVEFKGLNDQPLHAINLQNTQQLFITDKEIQQLKNFYLLVSSNQVLSKGTEQHDEILLDHSPSLEELIFSITGREGVYHPEYCIFANKLIKRTSIFYEDDYIYGFTNLKPAKEGHVLLIPKRAVPFYSDMTTNEQLAMARAMDVVNRMIKDIYHTDSATMCIQDGPLAGQTIKHVHCHIMPRIYQDFVPNDKVYDALNLYDIEPRYLQDQFQPDCDRHPRTNEEMAQEADLYKSYLEHH